MRLGKGITSPGAAIVSGFLGKEPEESRVGEKNTLCVKLSVKSYDEKVNGEWKGVWDNVTCWGDIGEVARTFRKGDQVLIAGTYGEREYKGKMYGDIRADFVAKTSAISAPPITPKSEKKLDIEPEDFTVVDESEDLPF